MTSERLSLLVVNDEEFLRDLIRETVCGHFDVDLAASAPYALELLGKRNYDMVLTDILMEDYDGVWLLQSIRADPAYDHIPVVAMTSYAEPEQLNGFSDVVIAAVSAFDIPLQLQELMERVLRKKVVFPPFRGPG